jgi:proline iminopeptidase
MALLQLDDGTELWYEQVSDGPSTCIALHGGLGLDHTYLRPAWDVLGESTQLVYLDVRGNGRSGRPALATITMAQLADDVDALRAHLGVARVGLAGHSYGGFIALEYARRHPDALRFLLLVDTAAGQPLAARSAEADPTEPAISDEEFMAELNGSMAAYFHEYDPAHAEALLANTIVNGQIGMWSIQQLAAWGVQEALRGMAVPTLVVVGRQDRICPLGASEEIAANIPDAQLAIVEDAGHFPWVESPATFNAVVRDWLVTVA